MNRMHNKLKLNSGFFLLALQKTLKFLYFKLSGQFILLFLKSGEGWGGARTQCALVRGLLLKKNKHSDRVSFIWLPNVRRGKISLGKQSSRRRSGHGG